MQQLPFSTFGFFCFKVVEREARRSFPIPNGRFDYSSDRVGDAYAPPGHLLRRVAHPILHPPARHPHKLVRQAHDHQFQGNGVLGIGCSHTQAHGREDAGTRDDGLRKEVAHLGCKPGTAAFAKPDSVEPGMPGEVLKKR
jgi:hypothetical protein